MIIKSKIPELPENQIINFSPSAIAQEIDNDSIEIIASKVYNFYLTNGGSLYDIFPWESLFSDIEWTLRKTQGSFPKRLAKWYYNKFKMNLSDTLLSEIGSRAVACADNKNYFFDIVSKFDWDAGEFGDQGSCFWESRSAAKEFMNDASEFKAMRLFVRKENTIYNKAYYTSKIYYENKEHFYQGRGRVWLWHYNYESEKTKVRTKEEPLYVLFNAYGTNEIRIFVKILASYLDLSYKKISLTNQGKHNDKLWINGTGEGYLVGKSEVISTIDNIDFNQKVKG